MASMRSSFGLRALRSAFLGCSLGSCRMHLRGIHLDQGAFGVSLPMVNSFLAGTWVNIPASAADSTVGSIRSTTGLASRVGSKTTGLRLGSALLAVRLVERLLVGLVAAAVRTTRSITTRSTLEGALVSMLGSATATVIVLWKRFPLVEVTFLPVSISVLAAAPGALGCTTAVSLLKLTSARVPKPAPAA